MEASSLIGDPVPPKLVCSPILTGNEAGLEHRVDDLPGTEVILKIVVAEEATEGVCAIVSVTPHSFH